MRTPLTLLLTLAAVLAPAGSALADTWSAPLTVPRSTTSSAPTQLLFDASGNASVIAAGNYGGKSQILRSEQFEDGQFLQFGRAFSGTSTQGAGVYTFNG